MWLLMRVGETDECGAMKGSGVAWGGSGDGIARAMRLHVFQSPAKIYDPLRFGVCFGLVGQKIKNKHCGSLPYFFVLRKKVCVVVELELRLFSWWG